MSWAKLGIGSSGDLFTGHSKNALLYAQVQGRRKKPKRDAWNNVSECSISASQRAETMTVP